MFPFEVATLLPVTLVEGFVELVVLRALVAVVDRVSGMLGESISLAWDD